MAEEAYFDKTQKAKGQVVEVPEDHYYYALGCVPPIYASRCWALGECWTENIYWWFAERDEKYYSFFGTQAEAEKAFADAEPFV